MGRIAILLSVAPVPFSKDMGSSFQAINKDFLVVTANRYFHLIPTATCRGKPRAAKL